MNSTYITIDSPSWLAWFEGWLLSGAQSAFTKWTGKLSQWLWLWQQHHEHYCGIIITIIIDNSWKEV